MKINYIFRCIIVIIIVMTVILIGVLIYHCKKKLSISKYTRLYDRIQLKINNLPKKDRIEIPILYINLNKDIGRNYNMVNQFKKYGIKAERIEGVYGKDLINSDIKVINHFTNLLPGELGCTLSHLKAIKYAYDKKYSMAVIVEDDISLDLLPLWEEDLPLKISKIQDWDIIQLSNSSCPMEKKIKLFNRKCYGTFAYVIKNSGMKNLLDRFYDNGTYILKSNVSKYGVADTLLYENAGVAKAILEPLFFTTDSTTTIHKTNSNDLLALENSIKSIEYYIKDYEILDLSPIMYVPIENKPVIWQVWPGDDKIPDYLQLCHETIKKYNSDFFNIILVTPKNIHQYTENLHPAYELLSYVHRADYLRCVLLDKYGGIYLDMDTICFGSIKDYFKNISIYDIVGYDGSRWGEIWGVSAMGPYRPKSEFTKRWKEQLFTELDKNTEKLKQYRIKNPSLKKDCLEWASLLRDIVLPLSQELSKKMLYFIDNKDWQFVTDKEILTNKHIPPIENSVLILNNALYPDMIKQATIPEIRANTNVLLFKLLNFALDTQNKIPKEILPGIHKILYINLDHRKDRNERIISEFNKIGIGIDSLERISAIYTPENGAIGCFESHRKAVKLATEKYPSQNVLICEDDIIFTQNRQTIINMLQTFFMDPIVKVKWDVLMLAHNTIKSKPTNIKDVIKLIDSQTSSSYLINGKYSSNINNIFSITNSLYTEGKKWLPEFCNDQCWKSLQKIDNWYGFANPFAKQGESYSDIEKKIVSYEKFQNTSNNGIFDFVEIGTSDFDTEVEKANNETIGLSVEPLKQYYDRLPYKLNCIKANVAISNTPGELKMYYVSADDVKKYNLPEWVTGANSLEKPHPYVQDRALKPRGLEYLFKTTPVKVITFGQLMEKYGIKGVKYLKIDTEGHDPIILKSMIEYCDSNPGVYPDRIQYESIGLSDKKLEDSVKAELITKGYYMKKDRTDEDPNIILHRNSVRCNWVLPAKQLQTRNLETNPEKIWGRQILLDVVKQSGIPYRLAYGTILGSLRHNGFIDNDGDSDVMVLANKKNKLWTIDTLGIHNQSYKRLRARIARVLLSTSARLYPEYIIDIHTGAYRSGKEQLDDSGAILGRDKINWNITGYLCTLTIWDKERKKSLNYPHVLDIELADESDFTKKYGSECQCSLYDSTYSCFEGAHKYCMKEYGSSYMTPMSATTNIFNQRVYKGGDKDKVQEKEGKNLQKRCKNKPYSEDLENLVKGKYGSVTQ